MDREFAREHICRNFCIYFKPEKEAEFGCSGIRIALAMPDKSGTLPLLRPSSPSNAFALLSAAMIRSLEERLCAACEYNQEDCDFAAGVKGSLPCGGFIYLGRLIMEDNFCLDGIDTIE